jgi:hypothetical protein
MDQPEAVVEEPAALAPRDLVCRYSFNMLEMLGLYDVGREFLSKKHDIGWWRQTFSLGVSTGGLFTATIDDVLATLAVFWRTANPIVDITKRSPLPDPGGQFVYIAQIWNQGGVRPIAALRSHLRRICPGAREIALHDQRPKKRGKLKTFPLGAPVLAERNGHGG